MCNRTTKLTYSEAEAAIYCGITVKELKRHAHAGRISAIIVGDTPRYSRYAVRHLAKVLDRKEGTE